MRVISTHSYFGPNPYINKAAIRFLIDASENHSVKHSEELLQQLVIEIPESKNLLDKFYQLPISGQVEIDRVESLLISLFKTILTQILAYIDIAVDGFDFESKADHDHLELLYSCDNLAVGLQAGELTISILNHLFVSNNEEQSVDKDFSVHQRILGFFDQTLAQQYDLSAKAIIKYAKQNNIPVVELSRWPFSAQAQQTALLNKDILQLGYGCHQKLIQGTLTNAVSSLDISRLTNRQTLLTLLFASGVPLPGFDVESSNINSARRAVRCANKVGYPVMMRTCQCISTVGSVFNVSSEQKVIQAYQYLSKYDRHVVVQKHIETQQYWLLVIDHQVVAACEYQPGQLIGDGLQTIKQLIKNAFEKSNQDHVLDTIAVNLSKNGIDPGKIPVKNELIPLHWYCQQPSLINQRDVLNIVHEEVVQLAVQVSKVCKLPIAGIELSSADISLATEPGNTVVLSVDPAPDLAIHRVADERLPLQAASRLLTYLFPETTGRIPIVAVTGTNGKTTTCRMVANILKTAGFKPGLACTDGVYLNDQRINKHTSSGIGGALNVFTSREINAAVLETSRGTLLQKGLAFDYCSVAACTNIANDHLGLNGIETLDQMAQLKRVVLESAHDWVVLNAEDPNCLAMIPHLNCETICLVSLASNNPVMIAHMEQGGPAVFLQQHNHQLQIMVVQNNVHTQLLVEQIPASWHGKAIHNIENAMFAIAIALGLKIAVEDIKKSLYSQGTSIEETPGRLNLYDKFPFKVILDYAHNGHGLQALCSVIRKLNCQGNKILVLFFRDNMREEDVLEAAEAVAEDFDLYICRDSANDEDEYTGATASFLKKCLIQKGVEEKRVMVIPDPLKALDYALKIAKPKDLIVYNTGPQAKVVWQQLEEFRENGNY